ncbi:hypothetical protein D7Z54_00515 [Salibacterium salarium]|uniref:Lipoprotein n=1 Tax=Salibacterium salarium TaxID=284579 RepID=A0A3R9QQ34_9BACI|nr:hypothetical protein [Salibacterium salarium]RSL35091.1 hypothetical protein D7Z54_00515 [Salibacterium salarium]
MEKLSLILSFILLTVGLFGCQQSTEGVANGNNASKSKVEEKSKSEVQNPKVVTERIEASEFVLEITTPTVVENGNTLKVKGTLTYIGDKTINLYHGRPIIRFTFSDEIYEYEDQGFSTELKTGQTIEVENEFQVSKTGKQNLTARTTMLQVNGELIEGIGNEKYIKENMTERAAEIEKSKIALEPFEVLVK